MILIVFEQALTLIPHWAMQIRQLGLNVVFSLGPLSITEVCHRADQGSVVWQRPWRDRGCGIRRGT